METNRTAPATAQALMTAEAAAAFLGVTTCALKKWRYQRTGPAFIRVNARRVRYRRPDLERWLKQREVRCA
jgi:hypothetical protein